MKRSVKNKDSNVAMLLTAKEMSKLCGIGEKHFEEIDGCGGTRIPSDRKAPSSPQKGNLGLL